MATGEELIGPGISGQALGRAIGRRWPPLVHELAALDSFPDRVVSLYLDVCWDDEQQRERARLGIKDALRRLRALPAGADPAIARDLDRVEAWVEQRTHVAGEPNERGDALYLCAARAFDRGLRSTFRFPNRVLVGPTPALRPLLGALPASGRVLCVLADSATARVYQLASDASGTLACIEHDIPRRHHAGGWSQLKLQHWRLEEIGRHHRDVAARIAEFLDQEERSRVLVGGLPGAITALVDELQSPARARVDACPDVARVFDDTEAMQAFSAALAELERAEAHERARTAADLASAGGRGAVGVAAVIAATNEGRLGELLLAESFCRDGFRCARCRTIIDGADEVHACPACGGAVEPMELGEALVHGAVVQDAGVTLVPGPSRLEIHDRVGALLRY